MTKVLIQWAFDIFHNWHALTLQYAKRFWDELIVALNTNPLIKDYKNKIAVQDWKYKKSLLESIRYVDKVISADNFSPMELLKDNDIDVYVVWSEWVDSHPEEIRYMEEKWWKVVVCPRWKSCTSTSAIKKILLEEATNK